MSNINFNSLKINIEEKISEIEQDYIKTKGLILTEDDLKCLLYKKLQDIKEISKNRKTVNKQILANAIHTEVSWFDKNRKLRIKPDITILEPEKLDILNKQGNKLVLPSKEFQFSGNSILFELKFIRHKEGLTRKDFDEQIMKDFNKIMNLFEYLDNEYTSPESIYCYFVIFSKFNKTCDEFNEFLNLHMAEPRYKIIYASGNVNIL